MHLASAQRLFGLDLLRAAAVICVFLNHFEFSSKGILARLFANYGWFGVDLFFVLSGFLIGGQLFGKLAQGAVFSMPEFYFRRLARTLPNYFAVLLVFYVLWPEKPLGAAEPLWRYTFFLQNFAPLKVFFSSWSLCVEEHFYLVFPLIAMAAWRRSGSLGLYKIIRDGAIAVLVFEVCLRAAIWSVIRPDLKSSIDEAYQSYFTWIYYFTPTRFDGITMGVLLGALSAFEKEAWIRCVSRPWFWAVLGLVLVAAGAGINHLSIFGLQSQKQFGFFGSTLSFTFFALGFACWIFPACRLQTAPHWTIQWGIGGIARLSFAIYLLNVPVLHFMKPISAHLGIDPGGGLSLLVSFGVLVVAAWVLYRGIERPALHLRDRLWNRQPSFAGPKTS